MVGRWPIGPANRQRRRSTRGPQRRRERARQRARRRPFRSGGPRHARVREQPLLGRRSDHAKEIRGSGAATIDASVVRLEGYPLSTTAPTGAALLAWDGGVWGRRMPRNLATVTFAAEVNNNDAGPRTLRRRSSSTGLRGRSRKSFSPGTLRSRLSRPPVPPTSSCASSRAARGAICHMARHGEMGQQYAPTLSTTANAIDIVAFYYNGTTTLACLAQTSAGTSTLAT